MLIWNGVRAQVWAAAIYLAEQLCDPACRAQLLPSAAAQPASAPPASVPLAGVRTVELGAGEPGGFYHIASAPRPGKIKSVHKRQTLQGAVWVPNRTRRR